MHPLRSLLSRLALALLVAALAGCAGFGGPRVLTLSESQLATLLEREFPLDRRLLEVIDVRVGAPRVKLLPESNRLGTEMELQTTDRIVGRAFKGRIALDYALRYDALSQSVRLTQVRVSKLEFDGATGAARAGLQAIGPVLAEQLLNEVAIYRFKPEDLKTAQGQGLQPGAVTVTSRGVEITLQSAR
jgi:hypothetical protein